MGCQQTSTSILVFNGSNGGTTVPEDAVIAGGYTPIIVTDFATFDAGFDAGGFEAIVWDVSSVGNPIPVSSSDRLATWIAGGGRLVFDYWDLDDNPTTQAILGVSVLVSFDAPQPIHPAVGSVVDLFGLEEIITPPLIYPDLWTDNGDELSLAGPGHVVARFNDPATGPAAILVTHDDRVITNGFMTTEIGPGASSTPTATASTTARSCSATSCCSCAPPPSVRVSNPSQHEHRSRRPARRLSIRASAGTCGFATRSSGSRARSSS